MPDGRATRVRRSCCADNDLPVAAFEAPARRRALISGFPGSLRHSVGSGTGAARARRVAATSAARARGRHPPRLYRHPHCRPLGSDTPSPGARRAHGAHSGKAAGAHAPDHACRGRFAAAGLLGRADDSRAGNSSGSARCLLVADIRARALSLHAAMGRSARRISREDLPRIGAGILPPSRACSMSR